MTAQTAPVVIVGAGIGGLAAAIDLCAAGCDVLVLERAASVGGKVRQVVAGGAAMDAGPTVFTMRWVFDELFERSGTRFDSAVDLRPATVLARHAWNSNQRLDLFADRQRSADAIGRFAGAAEHRGYLDFCERAERIYRTLEAPFLRSARPTPLSLAARAGWRGLPDLARISPFATMWQELGRYFHDPRLHQLFGRYATYCGSSPFEAPATLMLVAHVEQAGVWLVSGGLHRLAQALAERVVQLGGAVRCGADAERIEVRDGRACGVVLAGGERVAASAVVFNGDVAALAGGRLGDDAKRAVPPVAPARRSLSALTWNLRTATSGFDLERHNVFFSADYAAEFSDLFGRGRLPAAPTVYVCAQDRGGDSDVWPGDDDVDATVPCPERLLCLVNAPARGDGTAFSAKELRSCERATFDLLARCGLTLSQPPDSDSTRTTPTDFERLFPATGGALYGQASHGWAASFRRPGARSRLPGLYLAGGSTHPGPGVPMAALSGRQAAASLLDDRPKASLARSPTQPASTAPSRPAATPGGTSTR